MITNDIFKNAVYVQNDIVQGKPTPSPRLTCSVSLLYVLYIPTEVLDVVFIGKGIKDQYQRGLLELVFLWGATPRQGMPPN